MRNWYSLFCFVLSKSGCHTLALFYTEFGDKTALKNSYSATKWRRKWRENVAPATTQKEQKEEVHHDSREEDDDDDFES